MSHPELYVPGIPLPAGLSTPPPRYTLFETFIHNVQNDTHPPGYYLMMWFVTKAFGAGIWALRLPSVLLGVAAIGLIFLLTRRILGVAVALLAAILLAANGFHIFWSQAARMYSLTVFLSLLATLLLLKLAEDRKPGLLCQSFYIATVACGAASHVFFWLLIVAHLAWVVLRQADAGGPFPALLRLQLQAVVFGMPFFAISVYQRWNGVAELLKVVHILTPHFLTFGYLIPAEGLTTPIRAQSPLSIGADMNISAARICLFLLAGILFWCGSRRTLGAKNIQEPLQAEDRALPILLTAVVGTGWTGAIVALILNAATGEPKDTTPHMKAVVAFPLIAGVGALALRRMWVLVAQIIRTFPGVKMLGSTGGLILLGALLPFGALCVYSLSIRPMLLARSTLFLTPYVLIILAAGLIALSRIRIAIIPIAAVLILLHVHSILFSLPLSIDPMDHRRFATALMAHVREGDLIFLRSKWDTSPIYYYIPFERLSIFKKDFADVCRVNPRSRIWMLQFYGWEDQQEREIRAALRNYHQVLAIKENHGTAILYEPPAGAGHNVTSKP